VKGWCWLGVCVLAVLVVLGISGVVHGSLDPGHPQRNLCTQGDALSTARLLDKAAETYAKASEKCPGLQDVELTQGEADEFFAAGSVYALAAPAKPKPDEPQPATKELEAAGKNSEKAVDEFTGGLDLDPFDGTWNLVLDLELKKELIAPTALCMTAGKLVEAGLLTLAGAALAPGLAKEVEACETTVADLTSQRRTASKYLARAKGLENEDAAATAYAKALLSNADLKAAQTGLEGTLGDESRLDRVGSWLAGILDTLETALKWLVPLAVALLVLALLAWMAVRESAARWSWSRKLFQGLGEHPGLSFFYKAAVPGIEIKPFGGKGESDLEGSAFSTLLEAEIARPAGREPDFPFDRATTGIEPDAKDNVAVVDLLTETPATKLLGSAISGLSKLFRRHTILVTGHLAPPTGKGAGVFLSIEGNTRGLNESTTLWERTYDPLPGSEGALRWLLLIPAASAWTRWYLAEAQNPTKKLPTERWRADALFESAQAWHLGEDRDRAAVLYTEALEREPGLPPAAHNLSVIEVREHRYKPARERIEALRRVLGGGSEDGIGAGEMTEQWPTLDTASLYTLMLTFAYPHIDPDANPGDGDLGQAIKTGKLLVEKLTGQLQTAAGAEEAGTKNERKKRVEVKEQLELAEPAAVVVLASLEIREASDEEKETAVRLATEAQPNLGRLTRRQLRNQVWVLKPWDLIYRYVEVQPNVSRRTHYNLACYHTTLSEYAEGERQVKCWERALVNLRAALVGDGGLVAWAGKDPSLAPLKKACPEKFKEVLEAHTIKPHADEGKPEEGGSKKSPADEDRRSIVGLLTELRDEFRRRANQ
jgi:hypothetical protein